MTTSAIQHAKLHLETILLRCVFLFCSALFSASINAQTTGGGAVAVFNVLEDGQAAASWTQTLQGHF